MDYTCFECEKTFPSKEALEQHRKSVHGGVSAKPFNQRYVWGTVAVIALLLVAFVVYPLFKPSQYDDLAQCIADSGAKFYGAFWCPHCTEQKQLFGTAAKYLPYIECSPPDKNGQFQVCTDASIEGYPTWIFSDGTRGSVMSLQELSQKTSCPLP